MDAAEIFESLARLAVLFSPEPGMTRGELAILWLTGGVSEDGEGYDISARVHWGV